MLLHDTFFASAERAAQNVALVGRGLRHDYAGLAHKVRALAASLTSAGVRHGDRVALYLPTGVEAVVGCFATLAVGAVLVPVNVQTRARQLRWLLHDSGAVCLVTQTTLARTVTEALAGAPDVRATFFAGEDGLAPRTLPGARSFARALEAEPARRLPGIAGEDLAALFYTSGSAGGRRAVSFDHRGLAGACASMADPLGLRDDDVVMCALPLSCDSGLLQICMAFAVGARAVLEPTFAFPLNVLDTMARERVTFLPGVPTMFSRLLALETVAHHRLSSVRAVAHLGAPPPPTVVQRLRRRFRWAQVFSIYGLPECGAVSLATEADLSGAPGSVGRGLPGTAIHLAGEDGRRLPPGSVGELVVDGPAVMSGYWNRPEETARRLRPGARPGDRQLFTGDIFRSDAQGNLYPLEHGEEVIESRGGRVSPREVEAAIQALPGVTDVAVIAIRDPLLGEAIKAFVVLAPGRRYGPRDVIRHCRGRLEGFMIPQQVEFVGELPGAPSGKPVGRGQLRLIA